MLLRVDLILFARIRRRLDLLLFVQFASLDQLNEWKEEEEEEEEKDFECFEWFVKEVVDCLCEWKKKRVGARENQ